MTSTPIDRQAIIDEYEQIRVVFRELVHSVTVDDLKRATDGTKWNNEQMLFHMAFGYFVTATLLPLVHLFEHLPDGASRAFVWVLQSATRPFHRINYFGSCMAVNVFSGKRMMSRFEKTLDLLELRLKKEPELHLVRGMHFPVTWDPFFTEFMTLAELYRYPTKHFMFHKEQLTIGD